MYIGHMLAHALIFIIVYVQEVGLCAHVYVCLPQGYY